MDTKKIKKKVLKDLKSEFSEVIKDNNDFSLNRLPSKKNLVFELIFKKKPEKFPKEIILKLYRSNYAEKEYNTLIKLKKQHLSIPNILFFKKPYIILEKLIGVNLCDFINENVFNVIRLDELNPKIRNNIFLSVNELAKWIARLHSQNIINKKKDFETIVLNKGDTRLRDFVYNILKNELYGLDFEESYEGNHLDDLAWISCSLLDTKPGIFQIPEPTHKIELINFFLKQYYQINEDFRFSFNYFAKRLIEDLNIVIKRRGLDLSPVRKKTVLKKISKDF